MNYDFLIVLISEFENNFIIQDLKQYLISNFNFNIHIFEFELFRKIKNKLSWLKQYNIAQRGNQFNGEDILDILAKIKSENEFNFVKCILGVIELDLYVPDLNFIFGLASYQNKVCLVSTARIYSDIYSIFLERLIKESVHEIGHAFFGLNHCSNRKCVMAFSNSLFDTDYKNKEFCSDCKNKIIKKMKDFKF